MLGSYLSDLVMGVGGGVVGTMASFEWQLWGGGGLTYWSDQPVNLQAET